MTDDEWGVIAGHLAAAWPDPPINPERRAVYLDVLGDLRADDVRDAVAGLMREARETLPPPGVIRRAAIEHSVIPPVNEAREKPDRNVPLAEDSGSGPQGVGEAIPEGKTRQANTGGLAAILGAQQPSMPRAEQYEDPVERAPFNGLALAGLLVPILFGLAPWAAFAGASEDVARPMPLELLGSGSIGLALAIPAMNRARRGARRNKGMSLAAILVASLAMLMGFGALGQVVEESKQQSAAVQALGADSDAISGADLMKLADRGCDTEGLEPSRVGCLSRIPKGLGRHRR